MSPFRPIACWLVLLEATARGLHLANYMVCRRMIAKQMHVHGLMGDIACTRSFHHKLHRNNLCLHHVAVSTCESCIAMSMC